MTKKRCCTESGCTRSQPPMVRRGGLGNRWYVITRWRRTDDERIEALAKHMLPEEYGAQIEHEVVSQVVGDLTTRIKERIDEVAAQSDPAYTERGRVGPHEQGQIDGLEWVLDLLENGPKPAVEATDGE